MKTHRDVTVAFALLAVGIIGCGAGDEAANDGAMDEMGAPLNQSDAMRAEIQDFRMEVSAALDDIRADIGTLQETIATPTSEEWDEFSDAAQETASAVMADLDRLSQATADEARQIRRAASDRLAELEAEVARKEVAAAEDAESLTMAVGEKLRSLESDIEALGAPEPAPMAPPAPEATPQPAPPVTPETTPASDGEMAAALLKERLEQVRAELEEVGSRAANELAEVRDDLSTSVAELTREVRREWYRMQWEIEDTA
jgi:hypothetical protein